MNMMFDPKTQNAAQAPVMMIETVLCDENGAPRRRIRKTLSEMVAALKTPMKIA